MGALRRLLALSSLRRHLLVEAVPLLLACRLGLAVGSVDTVTRLLDAATSVLAWLPAAGVAPLADLIWAVETADGTLGASGSCLAVALAADRLLSVHGYDSTVRIGVARGRGGFEAHAWLERNGCILVGDLPDLARFRPLPPEATDRLATRP